MPGAVAVWFASLRFPSPQKGLVRGSRNSAEAPGAVRPPFGQPARTPAWSRARARSPAGLARPAGGACLYDTQRRVV